MNGINPLMRIKIYNDTARYIFPVLTMGRGPVDVWMQMSFPFLTKSMIDTGQYPFPRDLVYRIYINPNNGIKPGDYLCLTLPLYTKLVADNRTYPKTDGINPTGQNQFIDWWQGGTIQLFRSVDATPRRELQEDQNIVNPPVTPLPRPNQVLLNLTNVPSGAIVPQCKGSQPCVLNFYSDTADLPKSDPSQLLEYTLGARQDITGQPGFNPRTQPPNVLDTRNVDFDVSYVNLAFSPAAMGVYDNDQTGYVGTPQGINAFVSSVQAFLAAPDTQGWPQFVRTFANGDTDILNKLPSPLEIFSRLNGVGAPPDLTPAPSWPGTLWPPIEKLRQSWVNAVTKCPNDTGAFCTAVKDITTLMNLNYAKYQRLFAAGQCTGTYYTGPLDPSSNLMLSHVYGWGPFTESTDGIPGHGCSPDINKLEDTPCYAGETPPCYKANNYKKYATAKGEFDQINYNKLTGNYAYIFNPWVNFIHGRYLPAYSRRLCLFC